MMKQAQIAAVAMACAASITASAAAGSATALVARTPFERHDTNNGTVRYYLAPAPAEPRPLLLVIQGSGCEPVFQPGPAGMRATASQDVLQEMSNGRFVVMVVDKPGVLSEAASRATNPGALTGCAETVRANHSLPAWTAALGRAIDAARADPRVDPRAGVRVLGMSEGAVTAARLAAERPDISHVTFISGTGCNQWDDMFVVAPRWQPNDPAGAISYVETQLRSVFANPEDTQADVLGQTSLYWSTFGRACAAEDLAKSNADVFLAWGTDDPQIDPSGVEAIPAALLAAGRTFHAKRVFAGSHTLDTPGSEPFANLFTTYEEALAWMEDTGP